MFQTSTMLPLVGTTLYLLLSLNVVPFTAYDVNEMARSVGKLSLHHVLSTSVRPEPGLPPDNLPDTVLLTSGEIDPIPPIVVPFTWHSRPSGDTNEDATLGEYDDMHNRAEDISLSDSSDSSPPEWSFQEVSSYREEEKEVEKKEEEEVLRGIAEGERGPESTEGLTPQRGLEEASGWGVYHHATQALENEPPARLNESVGDQSVGSIHWPSQGTTYSSAVDLATPTQDRGRVDPSVNAQDRPQESQTADPMTIEEGLTGSQFNKGNNSRQHKKEDSLDENQDMDIIAILPHPDCNINPIDTSNFKTMNQSCPPVWPDDFKSDKSPHPIHFQSLPLLVPLYSDWNSAMATWGVAWEAHIYGVGSIFAMSGIISVVCLLGLPFRCPMGIPYFTLLHLLLLAFGGIRAFSLLYDAYSHQERLPPLASLLLSELSFPCLSSAFSLAFILLSLHSRVHSSLHQSIYPGSFQASPSPCLLLCLSFFHGIVSLGCVGLLQLLPSVSALLLLPRGLFVCLSVLLPFSFLIFYCAARAQTKRIFRLNDAEGGGSPEVMRPAKCPFAEVEDWGRAAGVGIAASLCLLACGGLQLYGLLHFLGLGGVSTYVFHAWPWWGYQLSCRLCEVAVCLGLSLIGAYPLFCRTHSSAKSTARLRPGSWSQLPRHESPSGGPSVLASLGETKSPVLSPNFSWSKEKQKKRVVCEITSNGQSEALPLCPIVDSLKKGITTLDSKSALPLPASPSSPYRIQASDYKMSSLDSLSLDADSTGDLHPPSPIDLSRSIDQALFSEALFSCSLFGPPKLPNASSSLSLNSPGKPPLGYSYEDSGLYRTTSCGDADHENPQCKSQLLDTHSHHNKPSTLPVQLNRKGGNSGAFDQASIGGSSQGLCSNPGRTWKTRAYPWANRAQSFAHGSLPRAIPQLPYHRRYRTLSLASQGSCGSGRLAGTEHLSKSKQLERDLEVQAEFVHVCRQIDSHSVCSDTIEL